MNRLKEKWLKIESEVLKEEHKNTTAMKKQTIEENKEVSMADDYNTGETYNKTAIIGLILSIIAIFGIGLAGIVGFILGIVALVQIKHTDEKGKGLAIAAIVIGSIWSFGVAILKLLIDLGFS